MKRIALLAALILYFTALAQSQNLTAFKNTKGLWGFKDNTGKVVVEPKFYYKPAPFVEKRAVFVKSSSLRGVLDENGVEIVPPVYASITDFKYGFAVATKEIVDTSKKISGKPAKYIFKGVLDRSGKEIVPVIYKDLYGDFSNGWFVKATDTAKKIFFYNTEGIIFTVPSGYFLMNDRVDGKKFVALKNGNYGLIDKQFKELLPFEYSGIRSTENGLLIVSKNNLAGVMDSKLKWILQPTYNSISLFQQGYAVVKNAEGLVGAINTKGILTTPLQELNSIYQIDNTKSALAMYKKNVSDKYGLIDLAAGKIITPAIYTFFPSDYKDGLIIFKRDNKKGLIDSTGKELFYDAYTDFAGFSEDRAWVMQNNKYGFIDRKGKLVIPAIYDMIGGFAEGLARVKLNGKYGFIDPLGKMIIPQIYLDAQSFESGIAWVKDEKNRAFYIDKEGREVK